MPGQIEIPYNLGKDIIQRDLVEERPAWILSAYGPGRDAPEQLFGGYPREQSPEEIRLHYLQGKLSGNEQIAINDIEALNQTALQQIQTALGNLDGAIQFIVEAGNKHPNRKDICQQGTQPGGTTGVFALGKPRDPAFGGSQPTTTFGAPSSTGAFGAPSQPSNSFGAPSQPAAGGFGQPSAMGQKPNPFGQSAASSAPAFGQPSQQVSAFGQSSALGAKSSPFGAPAFGQPSQPATTSAFGQPSQPSAAPAFGQPSTPAGAPAFGQPSLGNTGFGQSSALGQKASPWGAPAGGATTSPFGSAQPVKPNPFGQPSQQQQSASPFGQAAPAQSAANPFGQAQQPAQANPFGQPATQSSPFGQTQPTQSSPFGQPQQQPAATNPFGQASQANAMDTSSTSAAANPFGAKPGASTTTNPFGQTSQPNGNAASGPSVNNPYAPDAQRTHPPVTSYSSREPNGRVTMFKGRAVSYVPHPGANSENKPPVPVLRAFDGSMMRVWFPDGPPNYNKDTEAEDRSVYDKPEVQEAWKGFVETGKFVGGVMPEVPPKREWCAWDF